MFVTAAPISCSTRPAESRNSLRLPHPIGGRHHGGDRRGAAWRTCARSRICPRLRLWPYTSSILRSPSERCGGHADVSDSWPKLSTTDFTSHITKILSSQPDLLFTSSGAAIVASTSRRCATACSQDEVATTLAFGVAPACHRQGSPRGCARRRALQLLLHYPGGDRWPINKAFVQRYFSAGTNIRLPSKAPTSRCTC